VDQPALREYRQDDIETMLPAMLPEGAVDEDGDLLPAEEVAERLADALDEVQAQAASDGKRDPLGWVVAVNLEAVGLQGEPLLLTWSLDGLDAPESWAAENVARRIIAERHEDAGSVEVWVPKLETQSVYNVNLKLARESDGAVLASSDPVRLPE
jgi:hypothetical protein